jgi:hypothetical protein
MDTYAVFELSLRLSLPAPKYGASRANSSQIVRLGEAVETVGFARKIDKR